MRELGGVSTNRMGAVIDVNGSIAYSNFQVCVRWSVRRVPLSALFSTLIKRLLMLLVNRSRETSPWTS